MRSRYESTLQRDILYYLSKGHHGLVSHLHVPDKWNQVSGDENEKGPGYLLFDGPTVECDGKFVALDSDSIDLVNKKKEFEKKWNEEINISKPKLAETEYDKSLSSHDESRSESKDVESDKSDEIRAHALHAMILLGSFEKEGKLYFSY